MIKTEVLKDNLHKCIYDGYITLAEANNSFILMNDIMALGKPERACVYSFSLISNNDINLHHLAMRILDKPFEGLIMIHLDNGNVLKIDCELYNFEKTFTELSEYSNISVYLIAKDLNDYKTLCTSSIDFIEVNGYKLFFSEFKNSKDLFLRLTKSYQSLLNVNFLN